MARSRIRTNNDDSCPKQGHESRTRRTCSFPSSFAYPAPPPPPPSPPTDLSSQPAPLPPTSTPTDVKEIDAFAFALLYIQWLAYGKSALYPRLEDWPPRVRQLEIHCNRYVDELPDLHAAVKYILQYLPSEWTEADGCYIPYLKRSAIVMWDAALKSGGFISQDFEVQLKWYHALNYYAVENSLLCKFIIQGVMTQRKRLIFQAQGRLKTTRYKDCSKRRRCEDSVLREECMLA